MFIKVAVRELDPATLILGRIGARRARARGRRRRARVGARETRRRAARALAAARRRRPPQHGRAVLAALLGRDADRLRARLDHPGLGADLQRAARLRLLPRPAGRPGAARRRRSRLRRRRAARRRTAGGQDPRRARRRRDGGLLRRGRPADVRRYLSAARPQVVALRDVGSRRAARAAGRSRAGARELPGLGDDRLSSSSWESSGRPSRICSSSRSSRARAPGTRRSSRTSCRRSRSRTGRSSSTRASAARRSAGWLLILGGVALGTRASQRRRRAALPRSRRAVRAVVIALRRATADDVDLARRALHRRRGRAVPRPAEQARDAETIGAEVERSQREPQKIGRMIIEVDGERAGAMSASTRSARRTRIAHLGGFAVHPGVPRPPDRRRGGAARCSAT